MNQIESQWDKLLKIKTTGRDDSRSDQYRYPYEPTQYLVLERLANSGLISKKNTVLDYGTGKGRVCFYLSYQTRCRSVDCSGRFLSFLTFSTNGTSFRFCQNFLFFIEVFHLIFPYRGTDKFYCNHVFEDFF